MPLEALHLLLPLLLLGRRRCDHHLVVVESPGLVKSVAMLLQLSLVLLVAEGGGAHVTEHLKRVLNVFICIVLI